MTILLSISLIIGISSSTDAAAKTKRDGDKELIACERLGAEDSFNVFESDS